MKIAYWRGFPASWFVAARTGGRDRKFMAHRHMMVSDGVTRKMLEYGLNGHLVPSWGVFGAFAGGPSRAPDPAMLIPETTQSL